MATDTLKVIIDSQAKGDGAAKAKRGLGGLEKAATLAAGAFALMKSAQVAVDFAKFGADVQRQTESLQGLAQAVGTSSEAIVDSMQQASDFTIDRMSAMEVANRALMMDVAKTPAEFERLTAVARRLGQAMGMTATKSIDDFITAAGRQSMMIADNLGLTVRQEDAYKAWAEQIGKTADALTDAEKKQAFLNAMLVAGEIKVAEMGAATVDAAASFEQLEAAIKDTKVALADQFSPAVADAAGKFATWFRFHGAQDEFDALISQVQRFDVVAAAAAQQRITDLQKEQGAWLTYTESRNEIEALANEIGILTGSIQEYEDAVKDGAGATGLIAESYEDYFKAAADNAFANRELTVSQHATAKAQVEMGGAAEEVAEKIGAMTRAEWDHLDMMAKARAQIDGWSIALFAAAGAAEDVEEAVEGLTTDHKYHFEMLASSVDEQNQLSDAFRGTAIAAEEEHWALQESIDAHVAHYEAIHTEIDAQEELAKVMQGLAEKEFSEQTSLVQELVAAQQDLADASGVWVTVSRDNKEELSQISARLAADLTGDQRQVYQDVLGTVTEGGAEWLAAYNALQTDLTDTQRQALIAQQADLAATQGAVSSAYTGNAQSAEEAQGRIEAANAAMIESYKQMVLEGLYGSQAALGNFSEESAEVAVALGLVSQEEASMLVEAANITNLLTTALTTYKDELEELSPEQLNEFVEAIGSGEEDSILGALAAIHSEMDESVTPSIEGIERTAKRKFGQVERYLGRVATKTEDGVYQSLAALETPLQDFGNMAKEELPAVKGLFHDVSEEAERLRTKLCALERNYNIQLNITTTGDLPNYQHGTPFHPGGLAMVGEAGPEVVRLPRGSRVYGSGMGRNVTQRTVNYNRPQTVFVQDTAAVGVLLDQKRKGQMQQVGSNL